MLKVSDLMVDEKIIISVNVLGSGMQSLIPRHRLREPPIMLVMKGGGPEGGESRVKARVRHALQASVRCVLWS